MVLNGQSFAVEKKNIILFIFLQWRGAVFSYSVESISWMIFFFFFSERLRFPIFSREKCEVLHIKERKGMMFLGMKSLRFPKCDGQCFSFTKDRKTNFSSLKERNEILFAKVKEQVSSLLSKKGINCLQRTESRFFPFCF